jgi:hypothetical protein
LRIKNVSTPRSIAPIAVELKPKYCASETSKRANIGIANPRRDTANNQDMAIIIKMMILEFFTEYP